MRVQFSAGVVFAILAAAGGCSDGRKIVPVSGTVTLDGAPAPNVIVSFQPLGGPGEENPGRGSSAVTDANGKYTLIYDGEKPGALTGKHRVRIFPKLGADSDHVEGEVTPVAAKKKIVAPVFIPPEWNEMSAKEFVVPASGTDSANFDIQSKPVGK